MVGIIGLSAELYVPTGYVSGNSLSDTSTYTGAAYTSLGVTPGTYEWTWGSGVNQNFTLDIETVPGALIGHGLPVLLAVGGLLFGAKLLERSKKLTPARSPVATGGGRCDLDEGHRLGNNFHAG